MPSPKAVLHDIDDFGLDPNEAHTLIGRNGRLKSDQLQNQQVVEKLVVLDVSQQRHETCLVQETKDVVVEQAEVVLFTEETVPVVEQAEVIKAVETTVTIEDFTTPINVETTNEKPVKQPVEMSVVDQPVIKPVRSGRFGKKVDKPTT